MANILIVDDEPNILKLTSFFISGLGHQVFTAESGKAAIEFLKKNKEIDLILSDLIMPETNGLELCAEVGDKYPVVIISAMSNELKPETPYVTKALDYISKPFDIGLLKSRLPLYLHKHHKQHAYQPEFIKIADLEFVKGENTLLINKDISLKNLPGPILSIEQETDMDLEKIIARSEQLGQNIQTKAGGFRIFANIDLEQHRDLIRALNRSNLALGDITGIFLTKTEPSDIIRSLFDYYIK